MARQRWMGCACVALVGGLLLAAAPRVAAATPVEELTKRLPEGVVAFVGTSGATAVKGDFEKTALGRIWNDPNVRSFYQALKTQLLAKGKEQVKEPQVMENVDMGLRYAQMLLGRPLVIGAARTQAKNGPPLCGFAIVDAGDRKGELADAISKLEGMGGQDAVRDTEVGTFKMRKFADEGGLPLYWGWVENYFVLAVNDPDGGVAKAVASPRAAAASYLSKVPAGDDALVAYYDCQGLTQIVGALAQSEGDVKQVGVFKSVLQGLGLANCKMAARVGFAGADLVAQGLFEVPTPPTGVLAAYKPVDPAWLGAVDIRAVTASMVNFDTAGLYDTVMNVIKTVSPDEGYLQIRKVIVDFEAEAKFRIRDGLLASLAGPVVFYSLPAGPIAESPRGGVVAVLKLKDAELFEKTMTALGEFAAGQSNGALQISSQTRDGGRTVHVWTIAQLMMMGVMPAWSIANDHVVIGSSVELCDLGVKQLVAKGADGKSLLDAEGYKKIAAGLPKEMVTFKYTDSGAQLTQMMMQVQQFWPLAAMAAMQAGVQLPVALPSLANIAKDLGPSYSYHSFGPDGMRGYYQGSGIEASVSGIVALGVGAGVALPAIAKSRDQARNAVEMSNLKQIGLALHMYAEEHQGEWPADLEQVKSYLGGSGGLSDPRKPKDFDGPDYIYVSGQPKTADAGNVMVYENPGFCMDRINVLFLDGSVKGMTPDEFREALKTTYERLGKEMPEVKFKDEVQVKPRAPRPPRASRPAQT